MNKNPAFGREFQKYGDLLTDYLILLDSALKKAKAHMLLFNASLPLSQRKKNFKKLTPLIEQLKEKFRKVVIIENKLDNILGFTNHVEYYLTKSGIPKEKYNYFLNNIDRFVGMVHRDFPVTWITKRVKEWTELDAPYGEGYIRLTKLPFNSPKDILKRTESYDPRLGKYKKRIFMTEEDGKSSNSVKYLPEENAVEIKMGKIDYTTESCLRFVHILGYALIMLEYADEGKDPNNLPSYLLGYEGERFAFNFIKTQISKQLQDIIRYDLLHDITFALFAIDVYTNGQQDYDVAFAKAAGRCYLKSHQSKNPFYVFNDQFFNVPLKDLMHSINYVEFYLKGMDEGNKVGSVKKTREPAGMGENNLDKVRADHIKPLDESERKPLTESEQALKDADWCKRIFEQGKFVNHLVTLNESHLGNKGRIVGPEVKIVEGIPGATKRELLDLREGVCGGVEAYLEYDEQNLKSRIVIFLFYSRKNSCFVLELQASVGEKQERFMNREFLLNPSQIQSTTIDKLITVFLEEVFEAKVLFSD